MNNSTNPAPTTTDNAGGGELYPKLFESLQIGPLTLPNRLAQAAHTTGLPWEGADDYIAYHELRARNGVGLKILEATSVHPSHATYFPGFDDRVIPVYKKLGDALHPHGTKVIQQIYHGGATLIAAGVVPMSASDVPHPWPGALPPRPMSHADIREMTEYFVRAALRVQEGGLDGIEIHSAHGYLIGQFLSPALNHRDDEYGGSTENRTRFLREVLSAIREATGPDFAVAARISSTDYLEGGIDLAEAARIAKELEPYIDYINVSDGGYHKFQQMFATNEAPLAYEVEKSAQVTAGLCIPSLVTGRIMTLEDAEAIVTSGQADIVSMVRPLLADPELITKSRAGRASEVRPCIGTNQGCIGKLIAVRRIGCTVNPGAGEELTVGRAIERAEVEKSILVLGGGPAGLEAARVAALRGHKVEIVEMARRLGGQIAMAAASPHRDDMGSIIAWLGSEVERLGVKVRLGVVADPDWISSQNPDEVIIATGSTPRDDGFQASEPLRPAVGANLSHVYNSWEVFGFGGQATIGSQAVVHDDTGAFEAINVVEELVKSGANVTLVTRMETIAASVTSPQATARSAIERLQAAGIDFLPFGTLTEITKTDVEVRLSRGTRRVRIPADTVVLIGYNKNNSEYADELAGSSFGVHLVGDASGTRTLDAAIRSGHHLARSL